MTRLAMILALAALASCDSPDPDYAGLPATRVSVDGSTFAVRRNGNEAQAIRVNMERRAGVMARAFVAIEPATGCQVRPGTLSGDPAVVYARLSCSAP
ncbi:hypothetical protein SAMN05444722_3028 [Rhodovulum sp. ES.010]|nr:hypothetical protein SAMN05444722_3028 [Rhodovulum sp. ES.010]